jgi:hypothetical protein
VSSATAAGVKPTRNSLSLVSFGAPINILCHPKKMKDAAASTPSRTDDIGFSHIQAKQT